MADESRETSTRGGRSTATLNHLISPAPLKEWIEAKRETAQLLARLEKLSRDCAQHELVLRLAGVTDEELYTALAADRERREGAIGASADPSAGAEGRVRI
jgi:hypothetical protein